MEKTIDPEQEDGEKTGPTRESIITGLIGIVLLLGYGFYHAYAIGMPRSLDIAVDLFRDIGVALIVAVTVAWLFDKGYHLRMFGQPLEDAVQKVKSSTSTLNETAGRIHGELGETIANMTRRDASLEAQYSLMVSRLQLLARSSSEGIVAIHLRGEEFRNAVRMAVAGTKKDCWILGRTHGEMLGLAETGKGWPLRS